MRIGKILLLVLLLGLGAFGAYWVMPRPSGQTASPAAEKARLANEAKTQREAREGEAAAFAALGPDSSLDDYLPFLRNRVFADRALEGVQKVKSRQADALVLLEKRPLSELSELWQWNVLATREMCEAYGNAFLTAANRIDPARGDPINAAIDLEWQMPNLKWMIGSKCDLSGPLERAQANIRAVAKTDRLKNLAVTFGELKGAR